MNTHTFGTIAVLEFATPYQQGFEDIVEEVDISFQPVGLNKRSLIRDSENIAIIERDHLRVLLGWLPSAQSSGAPFLILAVGPNPNGKRVYVDDQTCGFVKDVLVEHLQSYLSIDNTLHAEATQPVSSELVTVVSDILRRDYDIQTGPVYPDATADHSSFGSVHETEDHIWSSFQQDRSDTSAHAPPEIDCSTPKRLTIYTLGATMLIYTPAVGASLLVYSTLRDLVTREPQLTA